MKPLPAFAATPVVIALALLAALPGEPGEPGPGRRKPSPGIPTEFTPVDTSRLMGSPDPLPLEAVVAFPGLKFERPVELTHAGDGSGRLFVVEQGGVIGVFENRADAGRAKTFLDIRDAVLRDGNEEGLLGLAFHPDYKRNGEFFVYYSTRPRSSVVSRFRVSGDDPDRADRRSEEKLLQIPQPYPNHNGGSLRFGPDGYLYIGLGDGGLANDPHSNAQNLETLLGSILRIDVDRKDKGKNYAVPEDNPFAGRRDARGEIWSYGHRNTWRLSFDRETGELWTGDVGQNRFEEINRVVKGGNYGWDVREGFHDFDPGSPAKQQRLIDPVVEYFRQDGQSVTGGLVYRGRKLEGYAGAYFYGDYLSGKVWALRHRGGVATENRQVARTGLKIAAFGEDADREMYLCAFDGRIYRLRPRDVDLRQVAGDFPRKLSQTGLFASVEDHTPAPGLIPYEVNVPFWTDYTVKDRYIALPEKGKVKFHKEDKWEFPVGTVFVKTFWLHTNRPELKDPVRLETRLFVHSPEGWVGYTYVYGDDKSDAELLDGWLVRPVEVETEDGKMSQRYYYPSRSDCMACHTEAAGYVLGPNTRQMNRTLRYHGGEQNQIEMLDALGVFTGEVRTPPGGLEKYPDWRFGNKDRSDDGYRPNTLEPPAGDAATLARAWLDVNCSTCHRPEGIAPVGGDMRFHTATAEMKLVGAEPGEGRLGPPGTLLIRPGRPLLSELILRAGHRGPREMPPVGSNLTDPRGLHALKRWVGGMPAGG